MSSHHFVKDKQEPALLIANGEACSAELIGQLLEWNPFVIALDGAIHRIIGMGIKVDALLGDFDRVHDIEQIREQQQPIAVIHTPDQEKTDLEKGIEYLIAEGYDTVNIVWATGKRADHTIANLTNLVKYKEKITIVLLDDYSRVFPLPQHYEKWYPGKTLISLIPVGTVRGIKTSGLKYNLDDEALVLGYRTGNSNETVADGFVSISHREGDLLLMECHD
jgi:thiamine pyrophosphokinase